MAAFFAGIWHPEARAAPALAGAAIRNVATLIYVPAGYAQTETVDSNAVQANVLPVEALALTQSQSVIRPPSVVATLSHLLVNTGNTTSRYTLNATNGGAGCAADTQDLSALRLVRDTNNNGVADPGEPVVPLDTPGALSLPPGAVATLLLQGTTPPAITGAACLTLTATTALQGVTATNNDVIALGNNAVVTLTKSASHAGQVVPGATDVSFTILGTSIGAQDAQPVGAATVGTPITVDGAPRTLVLLRDPIPAGTRYNANTLQSTAGGAIRLFRLPGDAPYSYRTADVGTAAIEVAIGLPGNLVRNGSIVMSFSARVTGGFTGNIVNSAQGLFFDGATPVDTASNTVVIATTPTRIGLAKAATVPRVQVNAQGNLDGTAIVRFSLRAKNYGTTALYGVQLNDLLEGSGATQFGSYTTQAVPAANQYTLVAGSLALVDNPGGVASAVSVNPAFTGQASSPALLAAGATLPVGAEFTVRFDMRINLTGRGGTLLNLAHIDAALSPGGAVAASDDSTDGIDPDPDHDGNPGNNSVPTPVVAQLPALTLVKTASLPRSVGAGVFDIDYSFRITNIGAAAAPNLRVIDNLNCTFEMDLPGGHVASWELVGRPVVQGGLLVSAPAFTGRTNCNRAGIDNTDASASVPYEVALSLVDGSRALQAGQSETITLTVRVTEKPQYIGSRVPVTNKAWAAGFEANTVNLNPNMLVTATAAKVESVLIDPMGTVYNAVTRQPIAGARVTFVRASCQSSVATPITVDEVVGGEANGTYVFNADGSLSMVTGADGAYQFFLNSPPVKDLCNYTLTVTPPAGSGYLLPSQLVAATPGTYAACGPIVPNVGPPQGNEPTTHYFSLRTGLDSTNNNRVCDVVHNHIPLDPGALSGLVLKKEGSKSQVEFGDFLDYALTVINKTGFPVSGLNLTDALPPGMAYLPGSARLNGAPTADPLGGTGPSLRFSYATLMLAPDASAVVRYRVRIGVGAPTEGFAINRAMASSGVLQSNLATWKTRITGGVFADDAYAFGKVYLDCKRDGVQNTLPGSPHAEDHQIGIPGVRLYLENGTFVITDIEGKWSLYGLKPLTHVLRLDQTTLPFGAQLGVLDNRNAQSPESRFVDVKKGEFHKANFIVTNCDDRAMVEEVGRRRAAIAAVPDTEAEAQVRVRLDAEGKVVTIGDTRGLAASGQTGVNGAPVLTEANVVNTAPLIQLPAAGLNSSAFVSGTAGTLSGTLGGTAPGSAPVGSLFTPLGGMASGGMSGVAGLSPPVPQATAAAPVDLEALMLPLDNTTAFIGLKDGDTVAAQALNVRVKGLEGTTLRLTVNSEVIEERRVGKKARLESKKMAAWEYIGVQLKPGLNTLKLETVDPMGNVRNSQNTQQISIVAPDKLGAIRIDLPGTAQADLRTPVVVKIRLTDANGVPVTARTQLTLEADRGRWLNEDLNSAEPGTQVFMEGGSAEFKLMPPGEPGDARIRVSTGTFVSEARLTLLPEMRPMLGVGIVEGVLDFTKRGKLPLGAVPAGAAFEAELSGLDDQSGGNGEDGKRASARTAFFFKGTVKGDYLLTAAYDSAKSDGDRLFRDIRPDEFYPVYGDSAVKGFDAQSTQKLYVRIDKNRSFLLYGDFTTSSSTEVRQLSQSSRSLTGLKDVYENDSVRATSYASRTAQTQQVEEFRAVGTSGPYYLAATSGELVLNSEQIEILVRDRNQPAVVLQRTPVTRFVDYTVEPLTRRILFTHAISSVDANLNPQSIRVTYESDSGGPKFLVAGTDVQVKVRDNLQLGVVASTDQNPENRRKLAALTAVARLDTHTTMAAEIVRTDTDLNGKGDAARIEMRHQTEQLSVVALASKSDATFDNPGASAAPGHTEAAVRAEYKVDATTALRGEAIYSKDSVQLDERRGASVSLQKKLTDTVVGEIGYRHGQTQGGAISSFDYGQVSTYNGVVGGSVGGNVGAAAVTSLGANANNTVLAASHANDTLDTLRGRLSSPVPGLPQAQVFVEGEQDIGHADRHVLAFGGNYAITDKTRLYGRYEAISTLNGAYDLNSVNANNVGILGVESNYMEGGRVYNEYRLADTIDGRTAQAAIGVRNTVKVSDTLRLTGGVEHTRNLSGYSNSVNNGSGSGTTALGESTAVIGGVEYMTERLKASLVAEARDGDDADTRLLSAGIGYKISPDWSLLARSIVSDSQGGGSNEGNDRRLMRHQIGAAYRPVDQDVWNALVRYEHRAERVNGAGTAAGAIGTSAFGVASGASLPGSTSADIVSAHLNVNPERGLYFTGRYAGKISRADDGFLASTYWAHLVQGRVTKDLNKDWDVGAQAGVLYGKGGALQKTAGVEIGYQVMKDLWLSGGYNFIGLNDRDLTANEYTSKGAYIRLRFKFDETGLGFASPVALPVVPPVAPPVVEAPATTQVTP